MGVAELNPIRRHAIARKFGLSPEQRFTGYDDLFANPIPNDAVLIGTPENMHFAPA